MSPSNSDLPSPPATYAVQLYPTPLNFLKFLVRRFLSCLHLNARPQVTPGISIFGFTLFTDSRPGVPKFRGLYALDAALSLRPKTVLDVGSGGGYHAMAFSHAGSRVLCVDYGTSDYAQETDITGLDVQNADFNEFVPPYKFDLVWASHILEHQRNVGLFIEKVIDCCSEDGHVCITVPDPHRTLWGGHLTLWSPGLLAYNIVLCGIDLSVSRFVRGTNEFSIIFNPKRIVLPLLTQDKGDLTLLRKFLPPTCFEQSDPWVEW